MYILNLWKLMLMDIEKYIVILIVVIYCICVFIKWWFKKIIVVFLIFGLFVYEVVGNFCVEFLVGVFVFGVVVLGCFLELMVVLVYDLYIGVFLVDWKLFIKW